MSYKDKDPAIIARAAELCGWKKAVSINEDGTLNWYGASSHPTDSEINAKLSEAIIKTFPRVGEKKLKDPNVYMWVNSNPKGASNSRHTHITYTRSLLLSGVYYVKVPENSGRIRFYDPRMISSLNPPDHQYYYDSQLYNFIVPQEDMILFFPSWLEHDVEENQSNEERISIGFNIFAVPEGNATTRALI